MNHDPTHIETKLAAARTRLILDQPFLGSLVMHLPLKVADPKWCATTATDARHFWFNPAYIARLTLEQTQFVLAHEAMHCALSHFSRRQHRRKHRWDVACDYAVNMILDDERLHGPEDALMSAAYRGLTAEEIYPLLHEDPSEQTMDRHLFDNEPSSEEGGEAEERQQDGRDEPPDNGGEDSGNGTGSEQQDAGEDGADDTQDRPPPSAQDPDSLSERWRGRLAAAAQAARQAGKLSPSLLRLVDHLLAPQLPWRALLAQYMMQSARDDYSFQRTSRRQGEDSSGNALLPRLASQGIHVVVALDSSGSVQDEELREFLSEVDALKAQVRAEVVLHACDAQLCPNGPWHFAQWEPLTLPEGISGRGGTDFRPVFDWLEGERLNPDLLLYFTDAEGRFPDAAPSYPVVWLVKGKAGVPFGVRIQLN